MALQSKNTVYQPLKPGDKVAGYLVSVGMQTFSPRTPGQPPSEVPAVVLQGEDRTRRKVLLGAAVKDDVGSLELGVWTEIRKAKEARVTRSGHRVIDYELLQDDERRLRA
jgi:hypothetical protein